MASFLPCFGTTHNLSNNAISTFKACIPNLSEKDNYVAFATSERDYFLFFSDDLRENNGNFKSDKIIHYYHYYYDRNAQDYLLELGNTSTFNRNLNDRIVYSNLQDYPKLETKGEVYVKTITLIAAIMLCCYIIHNVFKYLY